MQPAERNRAGRPDTARCSGSVPRASDRRTGRRAWSERGVSTVELAVLAPALMMLCMLIIQFGLWFNARQAALAAAQAGAAVARQDAVTDPGWQPAAQTAATKYYRELNTKLLGKRSEERRVGKECRS